MVGIECELRAVEFGDALDEERIGVQSGDLRAHEVQELRELLDVGFRRGVADDGLSLRQHGGDQDVFGGGHAGLVQEDVGSGQAALLHLEVHDG